VERVVGIGGTFFRASLGPGRERLEAAPREHDVGVLRHVQTIGVLGRARCLAPG
jgi:hypothetical protein